LPESKKKYAYWMYPEMVADIESMLEAADATSKSDFVCRAVEFYIGYLRSRKNLDYISPLLSVAVRNEVKAVERNLSELMFKVAVELAACEHILAAMGNISDTQINSLRSLCEETAARINGVFTFEEAYRFQHSDD